MDAIRKNEVKRLLSKLGIRLLKSHSHKFSTDNANYPELANRYTQGENHNPIIFDVGANVGQTALAFRDQFPAAQIHSFEPFSPQYKVLERNTRAHSIICHRLALGSEVGQMRVRLQSTSPHYTENSLLSHPSYDSKEELIELITVSAVDEFCRSNKIFGIDILKTDTEGYELEVLKGAAELLDNRRITNILCEATLNRRGGVQIDLFELMEYLKPYDFYLYSLYDVCHRVDGSIQYLNALFKISTSKSRGDGLIAC
jgi:FkbM family methyltransferase